MENQRTISYQEAAEELRTCLIGLYKRKSFPRMGKVFADKLFVTGTEAGGFLSVLADLDEIHVKRNTAQSALISLKRTDYILKTMLAAGYYTEIEVEDMSVLLNKMIPAVKGLLVEVYGKIDRTNAQMLEMVAQRKKETVAEEPEQQKEEKSEEQAATPEPDVNVDLDPDGFYQEI